MEKGAASRIAALALAIAMAWSPMAGANPRAFAPDEPHPNVFTIRGWGRAPGTEILDRSATIDWVKLEVGPPLGCPARNGGPFGWVNRVFMVVKRWLGQRPPDCDRSNSVRARVLERLRGQGALIYPLRYGWMGSEHGLQWDPVQPEGRNPFGGPDLRGVYPRQALDGHRGPAYWDHAPALYLPRALALDAPGPPQADVKLRYLVFRDDQGVVLALEPVASANDDLLARLRAYVKGSPFKAPIYPLADFLRESRSAAIVRVTACERTRRQALHVGAVLVSGDLEAARWSWWPPHQVPELGWVGDYLDATGQACRPGDQLLILGWTFPEPSPNPGFPRVAVIRAGAIRKAALLTGLRLDGPDEIPVTQALAWAAEGRRKFGPNIVVPPTSKDAK